MDMFGFYTEYKHKNGATVCVHNDFGNEIHNAKCADGLPFVNYCLVSSCSIEPKADSNFSDKRINN
jgi:hypothetical protein